MVHGVMKKLSSYVQSHASSKSACLSWTTWISKQDVSEQNWGHQLLLLHGEIALLTFCRLALFWLFYRQVNITTDMRLSR